MKLPFGYYLPIAPHMPKVLIALGITLIAFGVLIAFTNPLASPGGLMVIGGVMLFLGANNL